MSADDFLNPPQDQGFPSDLDTTSPMSGNRPASGARRATPGEVLSQGFQGAQNAGDFLGLDVEFTASQDPNQGYAGGAPLDLVPPPGTAVDDGSGFDSAPAPAPMPDSDPVQEFAQAPSAFQFGEDLGSEEGDAFVAAESSSSKKGLWIAALLVAGLSAGGVFYGPRMYARFFGAEPTVAIAEPSKPATEARTPRTEKAPEAQPVTTSPAGEVAKGEPSAPRGPVTPEPSPATPRSTTLPRKSEPTAVASTEPRSSAPGTETISSTPAPTALPGLPQAVSFPDLGSSVYEWASQDKLELIWRGSEVPLEALSAPAKTLMPRVGNVRVFTSTGDVFDGRLYAVGQGRVWIDTQPGRVGLDADKVARIEVLPPLDNGQVANLADVHLAGGKRVRVRVPGGMLYGRVLKAEGEDVTLALDDGGRVRVKASDLQELGSGRAVVVRR